jgi:subtilase family serine protease
LRLLKRPIRASGAAVLGLAAMAATGAFASAHAATASAPAATPRLATLSNSLPATTDPQTGSFTAASMSVEVALAPRNAAGLAWELRAVYTPGSPLYHRFLSRGQFDRMYAPASAERASVTAYLTSAGLKAESTTAPFLIRVTGSSAKITADFHTRLSTYTDPEGIRYYSNSGALSVPATIAGGIQGVVGMTNTVREHSMIVRPLAKPAVRAAAGAASSASCEAGYPTAADFFAYVNNGTGFGTGYGGGPGCSGLTPSQTNSIYGAPAPSPRTQGAGVTAAVFELSAYQAPDIDTWANTFYGPRYGPKLTSINVDGGPLAPVCPAGDSCPAQYNGYAGDTEVDADIETTLAVAKDANVIVYNAPNDYTGQTELDEYTTIANQDVASTVSSSWGVCENDVTAGMAQAENTVFEQMALQGQSVFNSAGDTGAFGCIRSDGTSIADQQDPASQPWVTSVGGTSLEGDNPGTNPDPGSPAKGTETVWNVGNLCSAQGAAADNDQLGGIFWCTNTGAGGGGSSQYWGRPFYQRGPGVNNANTTYANGTTTCTLARTGTPCREVPDISANADEYTGYAEYCTGGAGTPYSACAAYSGWFGIGGTSLSTPLWAAVIADRDGFQRHRTGNINPLVYSWLRTDPGKYLTDITGAGALQQAATNNGVYPTTPAMTRRPAPARRRWPRSSPADPADPPDPAGSAGTGGNRAGSAADGRRVSGRRDRRPGAALRGRGLRRHERARTVHRRRAHGRSRSRHDAVRPGRRRPPLPRHHRGHGAAGVLRPRLHRARLKSPAHQAAAGRGVSR